jgi:hypothetical protein
MTHKVNGRNSDKQVDELRNTPKGEQDDLLNRLQRTNLQTHRGLHQADFDVKNCF